jgi:hypothetical protein
MFFVQARNIGVLIVMVVATGFAFTQDIGATAPPVPRIVIKLPSNIPSGAVWIRYILTGPGSGGAVVRPEPNRKCYVIDARIEGEPAQHAKIVAYAPGCQFKTYTIDFDGVPGASKRFECDPLPGKTVRGFLPPAQIPSSISAEKKLEISGELESDCVCNFLLEQRQGTAIVRAGSCLAGPIPLGSVGELDPENGGAFEITLPDFTRDPLYKGAGDFPRFGNFGTIQLVLRDRAIGRSLASIKPEIAGPDSDLKIQSEYTNPVKFTTVR